MAGPGAMAETVGSPDTTSSSEPGVEMEVDVASAVAASTPAPSLAADGTAVEAPGGLPALLLVGNPNVGKSVLFGHFTGRYVTVSNFPGTTVEVARGRPTGALGGDLRVREVVDTPGINTLIPMSEDESVTRQILLNEQKPLVLQVADAKNLRRSLLITLQLAEMGAPVVLALNMMDELRARRIRLDVARLADLIGIPVVPTVATRRRGLKALERALPEARRPLLDLRYQAAIEAAVIRIQPLLPPGMPGARAMALMLAAGDETLREWVFAHLDRAAIGELDGIIAELRRRYPEGVAAAINQQRLAQVDIILADVFTAAEGDIPPLAVRLGAVAMHPVWGVLVLLAVLFALFEFVGVFGAGTLVGWIEEGLFGGVINPAVTRIVDTVVPIPFVRDLLVGDYGLVTMALTYGIAIVLPIVFTFFLAFSLLEDSGYLPRLAVMVNRIFQAMGLNGKAVLPMVLGLGCDTMATLTTRILDRRKERVVVTLLLALGVPCSAQLGVIFGMLGRAGPAAALVWGGIVVGVLFVVGFLAARVVPGDSSSFVLELPPVRWPQLSNILIKTLARIEWYLREAMPLFVVGTLVLFALDRLTLLVLLERAASPLVVGLLGLPESATAAFIMGFLRRDYGAAGFFKLQADGILDSVQVVVALVTMTLFIPCIANWFMMIKERGLRATLWMTLFILPFALLVGGAVNLVLRGLGITFGGAP